MTTPTQLPTVGEATPGSEAAASSRSTEDGDDDEAMEDVPEVLM